MDAKELKTGMKIKLIAKRTDGATRTSRYKSSGIFAIDSMNDRMICLKKEGVGYKETISMIDLRQGLYRMQLEDGTEVEFKPMVDVMKVERIKTNKITNEYQETKRRENEVMEKVTKERVKDMRDSGMTIEQMADHFSESYPQMRKSMLMAKITMLLSDKKPGKPASEKKPLGRPKKQLPSDIVAEIKGTEEIMEGLPAAGEQLPGSDLPPVKAAEEISAINSHEEHPEPESISQQPETEEYPNIIEAAAEATRQFNIEAADSIDKIKLANAVDEMLEELPDRKGDFIGTYTGIHFWPVDPKPEEVSLEDIAQALSKICRFNGHTKRFYSVAEHSLNVEKLLRMQGCNAEVRLYGLLHDAAEAYCCDIPRPLKRLLYGYDQIEAGIMKAIYKAFGLSEPSIFQKRLISLADNYILAVESRELMTNTDTWHLVAVDENERLDNWDEICIRFISGVEDLIRLRKTA